MKKSNWTTRNDENWKLVPSLANSERTKRAQLAEERSEREDEKADLRRWMRLEISVGRSKRRGLVFTSSSSSSSVQSSFLFKLWVLLRRSIRLDESVVPVVVIVEIQIRKMLLLYKKVVFAPYFSKISPLFLLPAQFSFSFFFPAPSLFYIFFRNYIHFKKIKITYLNLWMQALVLFHVNII